jgi:hypothetical protein
MHALKNGMLHHCCVILSLFYSLSGFLCGPHAFAISALFETFFFSCSRHLSSGTQEHLTKHDDEICSLLVRVSESHHVANGCGTNDTIV